MELGLTATINQTIDVDTASLLATEFGYEVENVAIDVDKILQRIEATPATPLPLPAMRARGAQVTDIVVLVVAADDGVMPQTIEAIDHAKAAEVPIIAAINKIDKPEADPERVKRDLSELGLVPEEWGGHTLYAQVSAKKRQGIDAFLELILLQAEMLDLKENPAKPGRGVVVEARLDRGHGPVGTVMVQEGTLQPGDGFVSGETYGRGKAMLDERGKQVKAAGPGTPI